MVWEAALGLSVVLVESVTVGLVRETDNGSSGASVVSESWSQLQYHMIQVRLNLYVFGLVPLVNS